VSAVPRDRQTLLFSATLSDAIIRLSKEFTRDAVRVDVSGDQLVTAQVTHQVHLGRRLTHAQLVSVPGTPEGATLTAACQQSAVVVRGAARGSLCRLSHGPFQGS
jgi:hypothetical protein